MKFSAPHSQRLGSTLKGDKTALLLIITLLLVRSPFAVIRRIALIIVYAFNRVLRGRLRSHISIKPLKRVPLFTHTDTTTYVAMGTLLSRIRAACVHRTPINIFRQMAKSMCCVKKYCCFSAQATTASLMPIQQQFTLSHQHVSALAFTPPLGTLIPRARKTKNGQLGKLATFQVNEIMNGWFRQKLNGIFVVGHLVKVHSFNYLARTAQRLLSSVRSVFIIPRTEVVFT